MYISTSKVFLILIGEIACRIILSIGFYCKRKKSTTDQNRHAQLLAPLVFPRSSSEVTHSSLEFDISLLTPSPSEREKNDFFESENESSFVKVISLPSITS